MTVTFTGEVHPLCLMWPYLDDDDLATLAESIREDGQREPIVLNGDGVLVDGKNRLRACETAGVEPLFTVVPLADDEVAAYIRNRNGDRVHLSRGQQAMGRGLMLQAEGKRRNGRWERGSLDNSRSGDIAGSTMAKVGLVLDVAERAKHLDAAEHRMHADFPALVLNGTMKLDAAYRLAQDYEAKAALAEVALYMPLVATIENLTQIAIDARKALPIPQIDAPLKRDHHERLTVIARDLRAIAADITTYSKEHKA